MRGLRVLAALAEAARPLSLAEIGEATQLPPSTAHRVLQSLLATHHVYQDGPGRYGLSVCGLQPLSLDHPLNMLRRDTRDLMRSLQAKFGPSVLLFVFPGTQRTVVDYVAGNYSLTPYFDTRVSAPLHASVSGKLLLSGLAQNERDALLGHSPYSRRTSHTIVDAKQLAAQLQQVEEQGIATNLNENIQGICAVGSRLTAPSGRSIGAIVLTGPQEYFSDESLQAMHEALKQGVQMLQNTSAALRAVARLFNR